MESEQEIEVLKADVKILLDRVETIEWVLAQQRLAVKRAKWEVKDYTRQLSALGLAVAASLLFAFGLNSESRNKVAEKLITDYGTIILGAGSATLLLRKGHPPPPDTNSSQQKE